MYRALDRADPCSRRTAPREKTTPRKALAAVTAAVTPYSTQTTSDIAIVAHTFPPARFLLSCPPSGCKEELEDV